MVALPASFITENMELGSSIVKTISDLISILWSSIVSFFQLIVRFMDWFFDFSALMTNPVLSLGFSVVMTTSFVLIIVNVIKGIV